MSEVPLRLDCDAVRFTSPTDTALAGVNHGAQVMFLLQGYFSHKGKTPHPCLRPYGGRRGGGDFL